MRPESWERLCDEKEREIAALVAEGVLQGAGRGKALRVNVGSFYDCLGEPLPVHPEWAMEFEVLPDVEAEEANAQHCWRDRDREAYKSGPTKLIVHLEGWEDPDRGEGSQIDEVVEKLKEILREGIEEEWRHVLDHTTEKLRDLHEDAQKYTGPFELPEPTDDDLASMREIVERAG